MLPASPFGRAIAADSPQITTPVSSRRDAGRFQAPSSTSPAIDASFVMARRGGASPSAGFTSRPRAPANLARAGYDLDEAPRLFEAPAQLCRLWPDVLLNTHYVE